MDATLATLLDELGNADKNIRARAAVGLGTLGDSRATTALVQALGVEREFFVREYLTWALVRMGEAAFMPLLALLQDGDARRAGGGCFAPGLIRDRDWDASDARLRCPASPARAASPPRCRYWS